MRVVDAAGARAAEHYRRIFAARGAQLACLDLSSDVNDFFRHHPSASLELSLLAEAALEEKDEGGRREDEKD